MVASDPHSSRGRGGGQGRGRGRRKGATEPIPNVVGMPQEWPGLTGKHEVFSTSQLEEDASNVDKESPDQGTSKCGFQNWEMSLRSEGFDVVAGTDEAGRGPLAGPVVAAAFAVLAHDDQEVQELLMRINDSKQMTAADREMAYEELTDEKFKGRTAWAIAETSAANIDDSNILSAALVAMSESVLSLSVRPDCVLVDGCNRPPQLLRPGETWTRGTKEERRHAEEIKQMPKLSKWFTPKKAKTADESDDVWRPRLVQAVIHGDALVPSISAASVLAKVHRDCLMSKIDKKYPIYGFASHQGYGTPEHLEALKVHGPCPEHRRSFRPVREALGLDVSEDAVAIGQQTLTNLMGSRPTCKQILGGPSSKTNSEIACQSFSERDANEKTPERTTHRKTPKSAKKDIALAKDERKRKAQHSVEQKCKVLKRPAAQVAATADGS